MVGICEAWLRKRDTQKYEWLTTHADTDLPHNRRRGYGGVGLVLHPLLRTTTPTKIVHERYQCLTTSTQWIQITVAYISPAANKSEEMEALNYINNKHTHASIVLKDLNARHLRWDTSENERGKRLTQLAYKCNWKIFAPTSPTCFTPRGNSTPDLFLAKGISLGRVSVLSGRWDQWSDHRPIQTTVVNYSKSEKNHRKKL